MEYNWPVVRGHDEVLEIVLNEPAIDLSGVLFASQIRSVQSHVLDPDDVGLVASPEIELNEAQRSVTVRLPRAVTAQLSGDLWWSLAWAIDTDQSGTLGAAENFHDIIGGKIILGGSPTGPSV